MPTIGIRYECDNWKAEKRRLICIDIEKSDLDHFDHGKLTSNLFVFKVVYNTTTNDDKHGKNEWWKETGKSEFHLEKEKLDFSNAKSEL